MKKVLFFIGIFALIGGGVAAFLGYELPDTPTLCVGSGLVVVGLAFVIKFWGSLFD